jgi:hypothetical protein
MTAALESVAEEEEDNIDFVGMCEALESLERRVVVQSVHIQQAKLEADEGLHQQLGEARMGTTEGLVGENMLGEVVVEKQFNDEEPARVEIAAEWKAKATKEEDVLGGQCDFPIDKERV